MIRQNYDYDPAKPESRPYSLTKRITGSPDMTELLKAKLKSTLSQENLTEGLNLTAETYYNSSGRVDSRFDDHSEGLLDWIMQEEPEAKCIEMETHKLLHLAAASKGRIKAAACGLGVLHRNTHEELETAKAKDLELFCGHAMLNTLAEVSLE